MVYINRDGSVYDKQPWSLTKATGIFYGLFAGIGLFLQSLIEPLLPEGASARAGNYLGFGRGGGSGGSGGGSGGDGGNGPRRRPMGRITRLSDITVPGGCAGGSCGR